MSDVIQLLKQCFIMHLHCCCIIIIVHFRVVLSVLNEILSETGS